MCSSAIVYRDPPPLTEKEIESGEIFKWVTEDGIGDSRWFFYDLDKDEITSGVGAMGVMHSIIECEPATERSISLDKEALKTCKKKVQKHVKNTVLKSLDAPMGTKPRLVCWMSVGL